MIIEDKGYLSDPSQIVLIEETVGLLPEVSRCGYLLIVVTNQSGIARGIFTFEQYLLFEKALDEKLKERGVALDATYVCPYHPDGVVPEYARHSECRKPRPGMILEAAQDFGISIERSFMVGDKTSDVISLPGLRTLLIEGRYALHGAVPRYSGFGEAWRHIRSTIQQES